MMTSDSKAQASITPRLIEAELLDQLPPDDPRAIRSRQDLQRVNFWMGHAGIIADVLKYNQAVASGDEMSPLRLVELGCGDGTLLLKIAKRLPYWKNVKLTLVDQQNLVSETTLSEFRHLGWLAENVKSDVFDWLERRQPSDCIVANLFLHHFETGKLEEIFRLAREQTSLLVACEPRRVSSAKMKSQLLRLIGCGEVTLNDAEISIRAGFRDDDLSKLWRVHTCWQVSERSAGLFSHLFVAKRTAGR